MKIEELPLCLRDPLEIIAHESGRSADDLVYKALVDFILAYGNYIPAITGKELPATADQEIKKSETQAVVVGLKAGLDEKRARSFIILSRMATIAKFSKATSV